MIKKSKEIFSESVQSKIAEAIASNQGNEVFFTGTVNRESGKVEDVEAVAYGDEVSTPVFMEKAVSSDVVIHNHPSGVLSPSPQDLQMAEVLMNHTGVSFLICDNPVDRVKVVFYAPDLEQKEKELLEQKEILNLFEDEGLVSKKLPGFELRESQQNMIKKIITSYNDNSIAVLEAGTGTGKSIAYLIPSIYWALKNNEKVVVSTYTKNLQHQLIEKDLPLLKEILNKNFRYNIVKGKGNYLCKKRFQENYENALNEGNKLNFGETKPQKELFEMIADWSSNTQSGDLEELPFEVIKGVGEEIRASTELCIHRKCPHFEKCFVNIARQKVFQSDVIIANHHFLLGQLALEYKEIPSRILPLFSKLVIDEAHNFKKAALSYLEDEVSFFGILKTVNRIYSINKKGRKGDLNFLENILNKSSLDKKDELLEIIDEEVKLIVPQLKDKLNLFFQPLNDWVLDKLKPYESTIRLKDSFYENFLHLRDAFDEALRSIGILASSLEKIGAKLKTLPQSFQSDHEILIRSLFRKIDLLSYQIDLFQLIFTKVPEGNALWFHYQRQLGNLSLHKANLETEDFFRKTLYHPEYSVIFTSATLSVNENFKNFEKELAIPKEKTVLKEIFDSPFDYEKQSRVLIPSDIPSPFGKDSQNSPFIQKTLPFLYNLLSNTGGGAFILCTSFTQISLIKNYFQNRHLPYPLFVQNEMNRANLLQKFKDSGNGVLLGTDSFWEGIDIKGNALRTVVILKLPFRPPSDPVTETLYELAEKRGENPFMTLSVPEAVLKFKQGFGRLIRSKQDKGVVVITDKRVIEKNYGKTFLKSLPLQSRNILLRSQQDCLKEVESFLKKLSS